MLSRREMVGKLAAGAAGAAVALTASVGRANATSTRSETRSGRDEGRPDSAVDVTDAGSPATASAPAPWGLLRPLTMGSAVAHGWSVAELSGVVDGTCVLTLQNERGRTHRIHVCRNDGTPQGLVHTKRFDLVVMNGGQGDLPTEEGLAQAVAEVAHVLAANESNRLVAELLPHAERVSLFAGPADRRLR